MKTVEFVFSHKCCDNVVEVVKIAVPIDLLGNCYFRPEPFCGTTHIALWCEGFETKETK